MVLALLIALQSGGLADDPRLDAKVSFRSAAAAPDAALKSLGVAANVPLAADGTLAEELLIFRLQDVPLREAMVRLASATGGEWTRRPDAWYLGRSNGLADKLRAAELADRAATIQKALDKNGAALAKLAAYDGGAAQADFKRLNDAVIRAGGDFSKLSNSPISRLADVATDRFGLRVLRLFDARTLAEASLRRRVVFSSRPNAQEVGLPSDPGDLFAQTSSELRAWASAVGNQAGNAGNPPGTGFFGDVQAYRRTPSRLIVEVDPEKYGNGVELNGTLLDDSGAAVCSMYRDISFDPDLPQPSNKPGNDAKLALTPDERAVLLTVLSAVNGPNATGPGGPETIRAPALTSSQLERLKAPDRYDPLAGFVSTMLLETADARGLQLVGDVPDVAALVCGSAAVLGNPTVDSFLSMIEKSLPFSATAVRLDGNWLELDGGTMTGYFAGRAKRRDLAELLRSATPSCFPIEDLARYAAAAGESPGVGDSLLAFLLGKVFDPNFPDPEDGKMVTFRVLGKLLAARPAALKQDDVIPLGSLDAATFEAVRRAVYHRGHEGIGFFLPAPSSSIAEELLPDGLPGAGNLTVRTTGSDELIMLYGGRRTSSSEDQVAEALDYRSHPEAYPAGAPIALDKATFAYRRERRVGVSIQLGPTLVLPLYDVLDHGEPDNGFAAYDDMPATFKAEVQKALERIQARRARKGGG